MCVGNEITGHGDHRRSLAATGTRVVNTGPVQLSFDAGGSGDALLLCIHGLGANGRVWQPFAALAPERWPGRWIAPDLRGHGHSDGGTHYDVTAYAADIAALVRTQTDGPITVIGHSLGGVIALTLADPALDLDIAAVFALGVKVAWSEEELQQMQALSERQPRIFGSSEEALVFYGRQSGLGPIEPGSAMSERAVVAATGGWRTAMDPRAYAVSRPDMDGLLRAARCPHRLARGATDPMVSHEQLRALDPRAVDIPEAGHNAMVDAPLAVWDWLAAR